MKAARLPVVEAEARTTHRRPALQLAPAAAAFIGRDRELTELVAAVTSGVRRIWIGGGSGIGKTELLAQLAGRFRELEVPYHWLAPHEPATPSVLGAIAEELAQAGGARQRRRVLVIDDFAALRPIELWFLDRYLPALPASITVIVADRAAAPVWRTAGDDLAIALEPLDDAQARRYLELRGVPEPRHAEIVAHAEGIPALLTAAANAGCGGPRPGAHATADDRIRFYTRHATDDHRLAIAVLAAARTTPYELLELAFDNARAARDAFAWLSRLSIVDHTPLGLRPHTALRKACERELADHAAGLWARARRAVRVFADHRIAVAREPARWLVDRLFVDRDHPGLRDYLVLPAAEPGLTVERAAAADRAPIAELAAAHQGEHAAAAIAGWLDDDRAAFDVLRDPRGALHGYLCSVVLGATSAATERDPAIELCVAHLRASGWFELATPPDARALVCRDWSVGRTHRAPSAGAALLLAQMACRLLTTPAVDYHFVICDRPEPWLRALRFLGLEPRIAGEHRRGGRSITALVTDWRRCSIPTLLQRITDASVAADAIPPLTVPRAPCSEPSPGMLGRSRTPCESAGVAVTPCMPCREPAVAPGSPAAASAQLSGTPAPLASTAPGGPSELAAVLERKIAELARSTALSPREQEVLQLLLLGRNYSEIGVALQITPRTARFHQHNVLEKIGAESRLDIIRLLL